MTLDQQTADLNSHRIEGFALAAMATGKDGRFSVPLVTHVVGNLWMGGCRNGVRLPDDFRFVVSLYQDERYALGPDTRQFDYEMYDVGEMPDERQIHHAADRVVELAAQGRTLVHCQAGLNRSGLITALAMVKAGWAADAAISHLRDVRSPAVLCNGAFEQWLVTRGAS